MITSCSKICSVHSLGIVQGCTSLRKTLEFELQMTKATILKGIYTHTHTHINIKNSKQSVTVREVEPYTFPYTSFF